MTRVARGVSCTDAIVILEVFAKKTGKTPKSVIASCRNHLKEYEDAGK